MRKTCWDMDGVICKDPPKGVEHPTEEYVYFLQTVKPLHIPRAQVDLIVTGRLEVYRDITEMWLKRHGVKYNELVMKPLSLQGVENTPKYKAEHYVKSKADLFIESCRNQAKTIAELSGKPVFCIENFGLY